MKTKSPEPQKHEKIDIFQSLKTLRAFIPDSFVDLAEKVDFFTLEENEVLFAQGSAATEIYIVIEGRLRSTILSTSGRNNYVKEMFSGDLAGIIPILAGGKHNANVIACEASTIARLKAEDFEALMDKYPLVRQNITEILIHRLKRSHLAQVLPEYFEEMDEATFDYIESLFEWVQIKRGDILYNKGDIGDSLYILINGLLHVIDMERSDPHRVLAVIERGEIVGEMAILSDEIRTAAIHAARDSDLVRLSRDSFENISEKFPQVMMAITRILVDRLKHVRDGKPLRDGPMSFCILPIAPGVFASAFAQRLFRAFSTYGSVCLLTADTLDSLLNKKGISNISEEDPRAPALRASMAQLEASHSFVLYLAEPVDSPWTRRCLKRVDKVLLLADAHASPQLTTLEQKIEGRDDLTTTPRKILILLHPQGTTIPDGTATWLNERRVRSHYHIRWDRESDFGCLARILSNRAIGLVLGGGAAKGLAHVGVIQALEESGIPIDMVGGASMGAIIGAQYAMGKNPEQMMDMLKKLFIDINPFSEVTIPLIALTRGRKLERMGKLAYGSIDIEDLWLPYFCVSSNLTTSQVKVHRRGSLWKAVRTSSSVPGLVSPVLEDGELYVDGGVINNLPGDIMRRQCDMVIVVEVSPNRNLTTKMTEIPSPWKLLLRKILPFKKKSKIPGIVDIMISTVLTGSFIAANSVKLDADLSLTPPLQEVGYLDFKRMRKTAELGYSYTMQVINDPENAELIEKLRKKE